MPPKKTHGDAAECNKQVTEETHQTISNDKAANIRQTWCNKNVAKPSSEFHGTFSVWTPPNSPPDPFLRRQDWVDFSLSLLEAVFGVCMLFLWDPPTWLRYFLVCVSLFAVSRQNHGAHFFRAPPNAGFSILRQPMPKTTVGGRNPAPPNKSRKDDSPRKYQPKMVSHGFKVVQDFVHPQYGRQLPPPPPRGAGPGCSGQARTCTRQRLLVPAARNNAGSSRANAGGDGGGVGGEAPKRGRGGGPKKTRTF